MNKREQRFFDKCMEIPIENYWEGVRGLCRRITSDHVINQYERISNWVYSIRTNKS